MKCGSQICDLIDSLQTIVEEQLAVGLLWSTGWRHQSKGLHDDAAALLLVVPLFFFII